MKRFAVTPVLFCVLAFAPGASAQAVKAAPATLQAAAPAPAVAKARMSNPVKGTAYLEVIQGQSKKIGDAIVTVTKVKNVSNAPIAGLRVDEFWYNAKLAQVSGDQQRVRAPIAPGEIVEIKTSSPAKPDLYRSQLQFSHANGKVQTKAVKKFTDEKK